VFLAIHDSPQEKARANAPAYANTLADFVKEKEEFLFEILDRDLAES
jgi:hypothetical protein